MHMPELADFVMLCLKLHMPLGAQSLLVQSVQVLSPIMYDIDRWLHQGCTVAYASRLNASHHWQAKGSSADRYQAQTCNACWVDQNLKQSLLKLTRLNGHPSHVFDLKLTCGFFTSNGAKGMSECCKQV